MDLKAASEIAELLHKQSDNYFFTISFDSIYEDDKNTAKYNCYFTNPIYLEADQYEIGLLGLDTYYSIPNVESSKNGNFRYSLDNQQTWKLVSIPTGSYEVKTLSDTLKDLLGGDSRGITLLPDIATLKCKLKIISGVAIDFTYPKSVNNIIGFKNQIITGEGSHYSDDIVNIQPISTINVNVDCISHSYVNGKVSTSIFGFFPDVPPGTKICIDRPMPTFLPFNSSALTSITVWLTDQNGELINFRGENITLRFYIRRK